MAVKAYSRTSVRRWWSLVASMETLGCLEPWVYGTLGSSEPWFYGTLGSSDSWVFRTLVPLDLRNLRKFAILLSVPLDLWILSVHVCMAVPGTRGARRSKGANLDLWIFGFSVPSEIRYPLVGALGSSDSIGAWRRRVPMESEDPWVPSVYWGSMRVVWFFRVSAGA